MINFPKDMKKIMTCLRFILIIPFMLVAVKAQSSRYVLYPQSINNQSIVTGFGGSVSDLLTTRPSPEFYGSIFDGQLATFENDSGSDILAMTSETTPAFVLGFLFYRGSVDTITKPSLWQKSAGSWARQDLIGGLPYLKPRFMNNRFEILYDYATTILSNGKAVDMSQALAPGWKSDDLADINSLNINSQGIIVGSATYVNPATPNAVSVYKKVLVIPGIEFKARDGMIEKGFDPPMKGDRSTTEKDDDNWQYWASVGRTGDLSTNTTVEIMFPTADIAKECHLEIKEGADSVDISPKVFTTAETDLTITGKNPTAVDITNAWIEVMRGTQKIGVRLRVKVMPVRTVRLGIYYVTDSSSPVANNLPPSTPSADSIITRMNTIYRQACIQFVKDPTSGAKDIPYDYVARDGVMDGCVFSDPEANRVYTSTALTGQINLAIVRHLNRPPPDIPEKPLGIWPGSGNVVLAWTEQFERDDPSYESFNHVCAHEVGHALKLSDRIDHSKSALGSKHDSGPYPLDPKTSVLLYKSGYLERGALMKRDTNPHEWMRHEDWELANKSTISLKP